MVVKLNGFFLYQEGFTSCRNKSVVFWLSKDVSKTAEVIAYFKLGLKTMEFNPLTDKMALLCCS